MADTSDRELDALNRAASRDPLMRATEYITVTPSPEMRAVVLAAAGLHDFTRRLARPSRPDELHREHDAFYSAVATGRYAEPEHGMWVPIAHYLPADPYNPGSPVIVSVLYPRDPEKGYRVFAPEIHLDLITLADTDTLTHELASNIAGGKVWNAAPADDRLGEMCVCGEKFRYGSCRGCGALDPEWQCEKTNSDGEKCDLLNGAHSPASNEVDGPDWHISPSGRSWRA